MVRSARRGALFGAALLLALPTLACSRVVVGDGTEQLPDASTSSPDASLPDAGAPEIPDPVVFPAAPGQIDPPLVLGAMVTSSLEVALFYFGDNYDRSAMTWEQGRWQSHRLGPATTARRASLRMGEIDGRPLWIDAEPDSSDPEGTTRMWRQLPDGSFSEGAPIPGFSGHVSATNYDSASGTFVAAGSSSDVQNVEFLERDRAGGWTSSEVLRDTTSDWLGAPATGWMRDGNAFVLVSSPAGLSAYRRVEGTWAKYQDLLATPEGGIRSWRVLAPPPGGEAVHVAYVEAATDEVKAFSWSLVDGAVSQTATLLKPGQKLIVESAAISADGTAARFTFTDFNFLSEYLASVERGTSSPAVPLRPDLAFDGHALLYHPGAGFMIVHQTHRPDEPRYSGPMLLERLDEFAAGGS